MNRKTKKIVTFKLVLAIIFAFVLIAIPLKNGTFKVRFLETRASTEDNEIISNYVNLSEKRIVDVSEYSPKTGKTVYFFTASWCGACNAIRTELTNILSSTKDLTIVELDINTYRWFANKYSVTNTPTLLLVEGEQNKVIYTNSIPQVQETVTKFIDLGILSI